MTTCGVSRRQLLQWSALGAGGLVLGGCGGSKSGAHHSSKDPLKVGVRATVTSLSPFIVQPYQWSQMLGFTMYDPLIRKSAKGELVPWIAEAFDTSDPTKTILTVRSGVTFHDGSPVTAADVAYSIAVRCDPDLVKQSNASPSMPTDAYVSSTATGDRQVTVVTKRRVEFLVTGGPPLFVVKRNSVGSANFATAENGTGPFKLQHFQSGSSLALVPNKSYWRGAPKLAGLSFSFFNDVAAETVNIRSGAVDALYDVSPLNLSQVSHVPGTKIMSEATYMDWWLPQLGKPPLNNLAVRKALLYCFDLKQMNEASFAGRGKHSWNALAYTAASTGQDIENITYDPAKAKDMLAAAGASGITVPLLGLQGFADCSGQAQILMEGLQKAGVKTSYKAPATAEWIDALYAKGNWEGLAFNAGNKPFPDRQLFDYMVDPSVLMSAFSKGAEPLPSVAKIYHAAEMAPFDSADERAQLKAAQQAIVDQVPVYFMFAGPVSLVLPDDLNGVGTNGWGDVFWENASY